MIQVNYELHFKKDLSDIEVIGIEKIMSKLIGEGEELDTYYNSPYFNVPHNIPSDYARVGLQTSIYFENDNIEYEIKYFSLTEDNKLIMVCYEDDDYNHERPCYFEIDYNSEVSLFAWDVK